MKKPSAILCSDIHLRETQPSCRLDDFVNITQWEMLQFLKSLQQKLRCPVICGGDLFHHWKPSPWLLTKTIENIPKDFDVVAGQHDLAYHNISLLNTSGIMTLVSSDKVYLLEEASWGQEPTMGSYGESDGTDFEGRDILVMHRFVWDGKKIPFPGCTGMTAEQVLDKYPKFDLIVTGDHHKGFVYERYGRLLVNPGCFTVQDASYKDYKPRVYLWYSETNTVEPVYIPHDSGAITREHIDIKQQHEKKLEQLVYQVKQEWESSFGEIDEPEKILQQFFRKNKTEESIQQIILKAVESANPA